MGLFQGFSSAKWNRNRKWETEKSGRNSNKTDQIAGHALDDKVNIIQN